MGMSTHVYGIRPPDESWKRHKAVWDACVAAAVAIPKETLEFFGYEDPDPTGVCTPLDRLLDCCEKYEAVAQTGFQIELARLPPGLRFIRFVNSW